MKGLFPVLMLMVAAGQIQAAQQKTVTWSRQATGEQRLEVNVSYGAGELTLGLADSDLLYHARFDYDEDFVTPSVDYAGGRLDLGISSDNNRGFKGRSASSSLDLRLSRDVPMDLNLDFGAGSARLNLSGLPLRSLEVNRRPSGRQFVSDEVNPERLSPHRSMWAAALSMHGIGNLNTDRCGQGRTGVGDPRTGWAVAPGCTDHGGNGAGRADDQGAGVARRSHTPREFPHVNQCRGVHQERQKLSFDQLGDGRPPGRGGHLRGPGRDRDRADPVSGVGRAGSLRQMVLELGWLEERS